MPAGGCLAGAADLPTAEPRYCLSIHDLDHHPRVTKKRLDRLVIPRRMASAWIRSQLRLRQRGMSDLFRLGFTQQTYRMRPNSSFLVQYGPWKALPFPSAAISASSRTVSL